MVVGLALPLEIERGRIEIIFLRNRRRAGRDHKCAYHQQTTYETHRFIVGSAQVVSNLLVSRVWGVCENGLGGTRKLGHSVTVSPLRMKMPEYIRCAVAIATGFAFLASEGS